MCRLGAVGWGAHSPRGSSHYNGTAAADGGLAAVGVVIVATGVGTGEESGGSSCYNDRSTLDAATVALSCK